MFNGIFFSVDDLRASIKKKTSVKFGLYYSLYEWFNPLFNSDKKNNFTTQDYVAVCLLL